ncbi:hypothetical protein [Pontiella sulfatireligans]|uniref:Uncharacterized protein n=1 Tax=Pontiella sulfatireligans TaxID=2750658 RepID=A0A6C2UMK5_9BACT|nr:hypothetical protein [Pontiella sulfatireligans]VGO20346.1 hypothetical protein SCARR_02409 [Pontiella sulfatireligans]
MMKVWLVSIFLMLAASSGGATYWPDDGNLFYPFAPKAGEGQSTAIHKDSPLFTGWADGYTGLVYGSGVDEMWMTPHLALGKAVGGSVDIVCLGDGGRITLTFSQSIMNGPDFDFAVFENAFNDTFLELAWVEVSSDGIHFCRFRNYVNNEDVGNPVAMRIYGLASKYKHSYGTPFDLSELQDTYNACFTSDAVFLSDAYANELKTNFPFLDLNNITHVRLIDVVGDGSAADSIGQPIYDPVNQPSSPGCDLDAVGVINQLPLNGIAQSIAFDPIPNQKLAFQSLELSAEADSGLPVVFAVQSGSATNFGSILTFTATGTVEVVASQPGNGTYAPASPVLRSFRVAEEIQHIFVEPLANQIKSGGSVRVNADASSGLPVKLEVYDGPATVSIGETNHVLNLANDIGTVTLRAFQPGDAATAPAPDVFVDFEIVESSASNAPVPLADWMAVNPLPGPAIASATDAYGRPAVVLEYALDRRMRGRSRVAGSGDLAGWTNIVPEIIGRDGAGDVMTLKVQLTAEEAKRYYRLMFEEQ